MSRARVEHRLAVSIPLGPFRLRIGPRTFSITLRYR